MTTNDDVFAAMDKMLGEIKWDPATGKDLDAKMVSVDGGKTYITMREFMEKHAPPEQEQK
jgi:hypothetical protein